MSRTAIRTAIFFMFLAISNAAFGQEVTLPSNPAAWMNSPPITNKQLEGKAALLYFFEES